MEGSLRAKNQLDSSSRLDTRPTCDRRTDRRTDGHATTAYITLAERHAVKTGDLLEHFTETQCCRKCLCIRGWNSALAEWYIIRPSQVYGTVCLSTPVYSRLRQLDRDVDYVARSVWDNWTHYYVLATDVRGIERSRSPSSPSVNLSVCSAPLAENGAFRDTATRLCIRWHWRNFVPYLFQLFLAAILSVTLWEMFVTLMQWRNYNFCPPPANICLIHNSVHFGPPLPFWAPAPRHCPGCWWLVTPLIWCHLNTLCR